MVDEIHVSQYGRDWLRFVWRVFEMGNSDLHMYDDCLRID